jgi:Ni/Co efflux regulator RcnB
MKWMVVWVLVLAAPLASAQAAKAAAAPALSEHAKKDITRHRAMAAAHEAAAKCLESGKTEEVCQKELQAACKGLAIGKYCGMRHEH